MSSNPALPRHIAIIMDGNGRWAQQRRQPRTWGHRAGGQAARGIIEACDERRIEALTLFAFSSENWGRPAGEVGVLMDLFLRTLRRDTDEFHRRGARMRFIGERQQFNDTLQREMAAAEERTAANTGLQLNVAVGYGGQQDILAACRRLAARAAAGELDPAALDHAAVQQELALGKLPAPDLFIRTGGEMRISNFLLWQLAYTELYFTDTLWPDFDAAALDEALRWYAGRDRRFGLIEDQAGHA